MGGYTFLQGPFGFLYHHAILRFVGLGKGGWAGQRTEVAIARFLSALVSAWISFAILNAPTEQIHQSSEPPNRAEESDTSMSKPDLLQQAGKTIDLTLFSTTRALEALIVNLWRHRLRTSTTARLEASHMLPRLADSILFAASSSTIMWSWVYHPDNLPPAYNKWIASAAQVDLRLIEILRLARRGDFVYGKDKGPSARQCQGMCSDFGWPVAWGDPLKTIPLPCEMVHMGTGPNCHWHACVRFTRAFKFAMATNFPLQLLARIISRGQISTKDLRRIIEDSARSSAFLGAFVALYYYGICLSRTLLGPRLFNEKTISRQDWDSGLCVRAASVLCGWSILIEKERRRGELAMFVAPRAAATFLPRRYDRKYLWRERAAFSVSTAMLFTLAQEDKAMVRGVLGRLLNSVLA